MKTKKFLLSVVLLCITCVSSFAQDTDVFYDWKPLSDYVSFETSASGVRRIVDVKKDFKFRKVALKKVNKAEELFSYYIYFSESPNGVENGHYRINTIKLFVENGNKKNKIKFEAIPEGKDGWHIFDFGKDLYLHHSDVFNQLENIMVSIPNNLQDKIDKYITDAETGTAEQMMNVASFYEDGNLSHIGLSGHISTKPELATFWKEKSSVKKAEEEKETAKARAEAEEKRAKEEQAKREQMASYGITSDENGDKFIKALNDAETGIEEAWAIVGSYYQNGKGVKKNVSKAIECYKKAIGSSKEVARMFGMLFMADLYWKGIGVNKDQPQAAGYYVECLDYTGWVYSIYKMDYSLLRPLAALRLGIRMEEGANGVKYIDNAIKCFSECVNNGVFDEVTATAIYKLGYYVEKGRYKAIRNWNGTYSPNIRLARSYYHDAVTYGDAKTKSLAKQGLQRIGY